MHTWQKYRKDTSDEERTNDQGYFTQLAIHAPKLNNNDQRSDILADMKQFSKIAKLMWH